MSLQRDLEDFDLEKYHYTKYEYIDSFTVEEEIYRRFFKFGQILKTLNLFPKRGDGTFGNISVKYKTGFLITKTGSDKTNLKIDDLYFVPMPQNAKGVIFYKGKKEIGPSSETLLHYILYEKRPDIQVILHTHHKDLLETKILTDGKVIPITETEYPPGTQELAYEAIKLFSENFFQLKKHGQIFTGDNFGSVCQEVIETLQKISPGYNVYSYLRTMIYDKAPGIAKIIESFLKKNDNIRLSLRKAVDTSFKVAQFMHEKFPPAPGLDIAKKFLPKELYNLLFLNELIDQDIKNIDF